MVVLGDTVIDGEVSPVDQVKEDPGMEDEAVIVVELPSQMVVLVAVMFMEGKGLTTTDAVALFEQPFEVPVTE